jgi:hypothetical protein
MILDAKALREITEADLQGIVRAGLAEHTHLEYKSALYEIGDRGNRELLLDICMFANSQGGLLLVGIAEARDAAGHPTGIPDDNVPLGIEIQNPEDTLLAYGARITACIEETLRVESHAVPIAGGRHVLAFRVGQSPGRPHRVRYQGHVYFPCRRERQRGELGITEIKEMVMQVASQLEKATGALAHDMPLGLPSPNNVAILVAGLTPVYFREFGVDIAKQEVLDGFARFDVRVLNANAEVRWPKFAFDGLVRETRLDRTLLHRTGLISIKSDLGRPINPPPGGYLIGLHLDAIDILLRNFMLRANAFYTSIEIGGPFLFRVIFATPSPTHVLDIHDLPDDERVEPGEYDLGTIQIINLGVPLDQSIKPFSDRVYQMFGKPKSRSFNDENIWCGPP